MMNPRPLIQSYAHSASKFMRENLILIWVPPLRFYLQGDFLTSRPMLEDPIDHLVLVFSKALAAIRSDHPLADVPPIFRISIVARQQSSLSCIWFLTVFSHEFPTFLPVQ